jgi:hypothetical protein
VVLKFSELSSKFLNVKEVNRERFLGGKGSLFLLSYTIHFIS